MNLADLRTEFQSLLNRSDCSDDQANIFIGQGLQRLQRMLRLPCQERLIIWNDDPATATPLTKIQLPDDVIQPIDLLVVSDGSFAGYSMGDLVALEKVSFRQLQRLPVGGQPRAYGRYQSALHIRGTVPALSAVHFYYYGEFSPVLDDAGENEIMASSPDLCTYAALSLAGDYFSHPKMADWEQRFQAYAADVQTMATDFDANGGPSAVAPSHCEY